MSGTQGTNVAIAHDYLVQFGGAERVVQSWVDAWPRASVSTLAYLPDRTYGTFRSAQINVRLTSQFAAAHVDALLPLLPVLSKGFVIPGDADIALISTSGFAHMFKFCGPKVVYFHSPARWLYESSLYKQGLTRSKRIALTVSTPHLRRYDKLVKDSRTNVVANSRVTQARIWRAYGINSEVINPPVREIRESYETLSRTLPDNFLLCVARARGYKNVELAVRAARRAGITLVVAGTGTESLGDSPDLRGMGRVSDGQLRSLYRAASAVLLTGDEDFGLTGPEANLEGTPSVAVPKGGYLETVTEGENGYLSTEETPESLSDAIHQVLDHEWPNLADYARKRFSLSTHVAKIEEQFRSLIRQ